MDNNFTNKRSLFDAFLNEINNEFEYCNISKDKVHIVEILDEKKSVTEPQDINVDEFNNCDLSTLTAFDDAFETIYEDGEYSPIQVQQISEKLQKNCICMINKVKSQKDSIEIRQLRSKFTLLANESQSTINKLQHQVAELKLQLEQQSTFSSIIGSVFGSYLWRATSLPIVVDLILQKDNKVNLVNLVFTILSSFIKTYNNNMPSIKTNETKFILNILGIIANLTTQKAGCHIFSQLNDGIKVIDLIISLVICIPPPLENNLKKIAYAVLYNVSIRFDGYLLMENNKLIEILYNDIKSLSDKNINETLIFALKLLHSLTRNINESMYIILKNEIKLEEILNLTRYKEIELTARKIYENIYTANEKYNDKFE